MNKVLNILIILAVIATLSLGCSGGGDKNPVQPGNGPSGQQGNPNLASVSGRVVDLEGTALGGVFVDLQLFDQQMNPLSATYNPPASGPLTGMFSFLNLPLGKTIILKIDTADQSLGRLLGYDRILRFDQPESVDLGDCILSNEQIDLGWANYGAKNYNLALYHFQRAFNTRKADALTRSSSAYSGMGWVYAKRGRDMSGTGVPNRGFDWNDALANFSKAAVNPHDADAFVGMAGTYMTLVGTTTFLELQQYNGQQFFYGYINPYMDESNAALDMALAAAPNYHSSHDIITANDLLACKIYNSYLMGESVTQQQINDLIVKPDLNIGSLQLLTSVADCLEFDTQPQL